MKKIKEIREKLGLSQIEVSAKAGISTNTLSLLENGKLPNPNKSTLIAIAMALSVDVEEIKGGSK